MIEDVQDSYSRAQIQRLTERLLTGTMGPEEFHHFESILLNNQDARLVYIEHINVHSQLSYLGGAVEVLEGEVFAERESPKRRYPASMWITAGSLVCSLLVCVVLLLQNAGRPIPGEFAAAQPPSEEIIGSVTVTESSLINTEQPDGTSLNQTIHRGQLLSLSAGLYQMELINGVTSTLQGPLQIRFQSAAHITLDFGTIVSHVPVRAIGFRVDTRTGQVVDLGTIFSVSADQKGRSEIRVFEGLVAVRSHHRKSSRNTPLLVKSGSVARLSEHAAPRLSPSSFASNHILAGLTHLEGVAAAHGNIQLLTSPPRSLNLGKLTSDTSIHLLAEQQDVTLSKPLTVIAPSAQTVVSPGKAETISLPPGTRCASYLLHCDFKNRDEPLSGMVRFDQPILGLVIASEELQRSDAIFALPGTQYPSDAAVYEQNFSRGCIVPYGGKGELQDNVELMDDGHGLKVSLYSPRENIDQIRILVQLPDQ